MSRKRNKYTITLVLLLTIIFTTSTLVVYAAGEEITPPVSSSTDSSFSTISSEAVSSEDSSNPSSSESQEMPASSSGGEEPAAEQAIDEVMALTEETIDLANPDMANANYTVTGNTITLTNPAVSYVLQGTTGLYNVVVTGGEFQVTLSSASITNKTAPPITAVGASTTLYLNLVGASLLDASAAPASQTGAALLVQDGANLVIDGTGKLTAKAGPQGAGIGGGYQTPNGGNVTIRNAEIVATGRQGAAIGGGQESSVANITIENAKITATASYGAGIGGGYKSAAGKITIQNSTVTAKGGDGGGAGIGAGQNLDLSPLQPVGDIEIANSNINATASNGSAGIGGSNFAPCGNISIVDSTVVASAYYNANTSTGAGIGGGVKGPCKDITITNSVVTATGGYRGGAGIGAGYRGGDVKTGSIIGCGNITINGGKVTAYGGQGYGGAGIGGGYYGAEAGNITLNNADVTAIAKGPGAGIGGGSFASSSGNITINGGKVYASASTSARGAGIGGGDFSNYASTAGDIKILNGADVTAVGGNKIYAIGDGYSTSVAGTIYIESGTAVRAYAKDITAIAPGKIEADNSTYLVNAYNSNGVADTFVALSATKQIDVLSTSNTILSIPAGYTSFAYTAPAGEYSHYFTDGSYWWMIQLDDNYWVPSSTSVVNIPLKLISVPTVYGVTYDFQDKEGTKQELEILAGGLLKDAPQPTKPGHVFAGWFTDTTFTPDKEWNFLTDRVNSNLTLYAHYEALEFTASFDSMGGTAVPSQSLLYGGLLTEPQAPTKPGYQFVFWNMTEDGAGVTWDFTTMPLEEDITLFAQYNKEGYQVAFESNGGSKVLSQTVLFNELVTEPADPTRAGYTFAGWYAESGLVTRWDFQTRTIAEETTLFAKWLQNDSSSAAPASSSAAPASSSVAPASSSVAPASSSVAPASSSVAPASSSVAPASSSRVTPASSSMPPASSSRVTPASSSAVPVSGNSVAPASSSGVTPAQPESIVPTAASGAPAGNITTSQQREDVREKIIEAGIPTVQIGTTEVPLFGGGQMFVWSLLSLVLMIGGIGFALLTAVKMLMNKAGVRGNRQKVFGLIAIALGAVSLIAFFIVYNLSGVMVLADAKTILFAILLAAEVGAMVIANLNKKDTVY